MARGWESKNVEEQIQAAEDRAALARKEQISSERVALEKQRESLELSRTRVLQDLEAVKNDGYRKLLEESLQYLDAKLADLELSKP